MLLHDRIQQLRKARGISQEELAEQMGVSRQSVSKWESGQSVPDVDKVIALAALFGVPTDYLLTGMGGATGTNMPRKIDMRIFTAVGTVINMLGLGLLIGGGQQFATVLAGLIFQAVGCMVFGAGFIFATEHKTRAVRWFTLVNLWPLLYMPVGVLYAQINWPMRQWLTWLPQAWRLGGWHRNLLQFAAGWQGWFWLGWIVFCLLATLILCAVWRKKK